MVETKPVSKKAVFDNNKNAKIYEKSKKHQNIDWIVSLFWMKQLSLVTQGFEQSLNFGIDFTKQGPG